MKLVHIFEELEDTSQINWNFYFSGLCVYSFGGAHNDMDEYISRTRGKQHQTPVDFVRGVLRMRTAVILYDENALKQEQRKQLAQCLKELIEMNLTVGKVRIMAFEEGGNYNAEEYFTQMV